ncbi:hypothetical protein [Sphingomonas jatrophae]|uniref:Uncharacterized protein n=1 Tax=Sphingomonas jatrophae TaxID=1166337 RepID=A0A1I6JK16_9SPHN|nr:hypothetical protein [Sphingomonas jatrophae]SFR79272.1 hypothetical protein SAMN05192580_0374 [Sphingomonas jatrophae]
MKNFALGLVASLLSAAYWWIVFTIVYAHALFAGDRNPAAPPPADADVMTRSVTTIVIGVLLYAVLAMLWQRMTVRWRR